MASGIPKVVVIGSGLSAVGAIKALTARGLRPTVLDWGETLDAQRTSMVDALAAKKPQEWTLQERADLARNPTVKDGSSIPKKLVFGSDYFYGRSRDEVPVHSYGNTPPFSYALGGLSAGWGAAVLPPQACDLADWPVDVDEIREYCAKVLQCVPYSAREDELNLDFPILRTTGSALQPSRAEKWLLDAMRSAGILKKGETVFGQARLLVDASPQGKHACKYCGQCMSGCVYGSIYKAGDDIEAMSAKREIDYQPGVLVKRLEEVGEKVVVHFLDVNGQSSKKEFDRVFLAAGAVNSARVVFESLGITRQKVKLRSRGGFVIPMLSMRKLPIDWPSCNTQPGVFLELRGPGLEHWVHVQISVENELLLQKLGVGVGAVGLIARMTRFIASHVILIFVNYHSDHAGSYEIWLEPTTQAGVNRLCSSHHKMFPQSNVLRKSWLKLFILFARIGCFPLFPLAKLNSGAYHVGGTLPMRSQPSGQLETDTLGRIASWKRVHVVDTATFPSLPGTTIGLLAMANAYRIADKVHQLD